MGGSGVVDCASVDDAVSTERVVPVVDGGLVVVGADDSDATVVVVVGVGSTQATIPTVTYV